MRSNTWLERRCLLAACPFHRRNVFQLQVSSVRRSGRKMDSLINAPHTYSIRLIEPRQHVAEYRTFKMHNSVAVRSTASVSQDDPAAQAYRASHVRKCFRMHSETFEFLQSTYDPGDRRRLMRPPVTLTRFVIHFTPYLVETGK